ncbi:MAG: GDP-mannose 4,6-dehydratase [Halobacteriota archaeon]|nr:GDP-mannose 4,6-dehydratase [Halobacteriota archaeon]
MGKVLVTGGLGQIGSYIVERLSDMHKVTVIDNYSSPAKEEVPDGVNVIRADVQDPNIQKVVSENNVIIHTAAQISVERSTRDPLFDALNNINGTINLLEAARSGAVERFVYLSSAAVFGEPVKLPIDELHPQNPLSPYGVSKLGGEKYCMAYHSTYGLATVCTRLFNIYSPRQNPENPYSGVISKFIDCVADGKPPLIFGDGSQTRDFVSVHDVVDMITIVMEEEDAIGEVYNVGTGNKINIYDLAKLVIELSGKDLDIEYCESRKGDIVESYADISKAKKIGYLPKIKLKEGLMDMIS